MTKKPKLTVVNPTTDKPGATPPPALRKTGASLWQTVMSEHRIRDSARLEILLQLCMAADRAVECAGFIDRDGPVVPGMNGTVKEHPLLKTELASRAFVVRGLERLGIVESKKTVGRPALGFGWLGEDK